MNFHETILGRRFFEGDIPRLIKAIERVADNLDVLASQQAQMSEAETSAAACQPSFGVWHDLRKDPKDLPREDGFYIVAMNGDLWGAPDEWVSTTSGFYDGKWDDEATVIKWMPFPDIGEI